MQSGLIEEIIGDTMESLDDDEINAVADAEVDRIVTEITTGAFAGTGPTPVGGLKTATAAGAAPVKEETAAAEEDAATAALLKQLQAL